MANNSRDYALVVGIDDYPSFRPLTGAVADATQFAAWLTDQLQGGGLPAENCKTVYSEPDPLQPLQNEIDTALEDIVARIGDARARRFYFYFSGHGFAETQTRSHLCLASWSEVRRRFALDAANYLDTIAASGRFDEIVFLMDCCRVRSVRPQGLPCTLDWARPQNAPQTQIFQAYAAEIFTRAFEAPDAGGEMHGHFTQALLEGLGGGAVRNGSGALAYDLKTYLEVNVPRLAANRQRPEILNGLGTSVRFGDVPAPDAAPAVTITFVRPHPGMVTLEGPDANPIRCDLATTGPWVMGLATGLHVLTSGLDEKSFRVRVGMEALHVEF